MIVYIIVIYMNYHPAKLYFFFQKKEKKARICILYPCFCSKVTREKVYDTQKTQKDDLAKRKVILFIELLHVVQERAEGPKAPSPGHRPGDNGNQQGAL